MDGNPRFLHPEYEKEVFDIFIQKKKITFQDVTLKPNSVTPDIQDISKVIFQEGKKVLQNMQG